MSLTLPLKRFHHQLSSQRTTLLFHDPIYKSTTSHPSIVEAARIPNSPRNFQHQVARMAPSQPLPTSMVAQQLHSASSIESNLRLNQVAPVPQLKADQTLIKVLSAGLNPVDYKIAELPFVSRLAIGFPHTPGIDYVGRVWETKLAQGEGIKAGDLVYGKHDAPVKSGTLGEFTVISGREGVIKCPDDVELDDLAAIGVAGLTAYQSLVPYLGLDGQGKSVFINGGSGGTGTFGVQIAKKVLGCTVLTSCSGTNVNLCKELGADEVIDYRSQDVVETLKRWVKEKNGGKKLDLIVDNVGVDASLYWNCQDYLSEDCRYVQVGGTPNLQTMKHMMQILLWPGFLGGGKRKFSLIACKTEKEGLTKIGQWMKEGKVKAVIDETFELKDADKAFKKMKTGRNRGKVVVRVSEAGRGSGS